MTTVGAGWISRCRPAVPVGEYAGTPVWSVAPPDGGPLALDTSLQSAGVADCAVLCLRDVSLGEYGEPVVR